MKKNTILNQEMKAASNPSEAWHNSIQYFLDTEAEAYKDLSKEQLSSLLQSARALQKENGYLCLYEDSTMPGDARADIIYKLSYAIAGISIYSYLNYPDIFNEELNRFFHHLLEGAFLHGIIGHGIESDETVRRTLLMLCKAGLRTFLTRHHEEHLLFAYTIHQHMTCFEELSERIDTEHIIVTANGFSSDSINHLIKELVAYWKGNTNSLFVYGTLMKGERANWMLSSGDYVGTFQLENHAMYNLGSYPGIKSLAGESVIGELYFVNDEIVSRLDQYEGEGYLYNRILVNITTGNSYTPAWTYVYNQDISGCQKMREAWNAHDDDLIWYAGYGSNLSNDRFSCYISGGICTENGKHYMGSSDSTPPRAIQKRSYPGKIYFGNSSSSWDNCGVAFYNPGQKTNNNTNNNYVYMKLYLITRHQLHDVMAQEGPSPNWYGRLVCLEVDDHGIPVYTLTSEKRRPENAPAYAYKALMADVLKREFQLSDSQINDYLKQ